jgi:hypothetical protein
MRFQKERVVDHAPAGIDPVTGFPHTTAVVTQAGVDDLVLGNGASVWNVPQTDGSILAVMSTALPAAYTADALFEIRLKDNRQWYMHVHTRALGGAALTGVVCVMEFEDPDHPGLWIPSRENVARDAGFAAQEWTLLGVTGWILTTREEHMHFHRARARFHAAAGAADAATEIVCSYYTDGGQSPYSDD